VPANKESATFQFVKTGKTNSRSAKRLARGVERVTERGLRGLRAGGELDAAVDGAIISKYRNAGQTCVCANRIYVQAGVYDAFAERLFGRQITHGADQHPRRELDGHRSRAGLGGR